jgi:glycosyltransferase involved in cell wall biosynthesis
MSACIWYVSKYVALPAKGSAGSRGFMLMREFVTAGYESVIITSNSNQLAEVPELNAPYEFQNLDGVKIYWVRTLKYEIAKSMSRILSWLHFEWRLLLMPKTDLPIPEVVVISSLSLLTILNGLRWRHRYKCRLVFEIRDIWPLTLTEEGGFSKNNIFVMGLEWIEKLGYRHSDAIVGTMPNLLEHVTKQVGPGKHVHCIPMGIDLASLSDNLPLPVEYENSYIPKNKFIVAHVGSIGITNALDTFLNCAETMRENENVHFLLVGDGDLRSTYVERYGYLSNVTFAPKVPKQMVQSVLQLSDLVYFAVHDSEVWRYGQSLNKVIDYMLSGKPVLASYTGFPSMINESGCGTFVPCGDVYDLSREILRYAAMPISEREAIGSTGRRWLLNNRSYSILAKHYLRILFPNVNIIAGEVV